MATLIPSIGTCVSRMTSGERRVAERLEAKLDDGIPLLKPISCGRDGQAPVIIKLPTLRDEAFAIADHLGQAHQEGHAGGDMAVLCASALAQRKLLFNVRKRSGDFNPGANAIQVMTMNVARYAGDTAVAGHSQRRQRVWTTAKRHCLG